MLILELLKPRSDSFKMYFIGRIFLSSEKVVWSWIVFLVGIEYVCVISHHMFANCMDKLDSASVASASLKFLKLMPTIQQLIISLKFQSLYSPLALNLSIFKGTK